MRSYVIGAGGRLGGKIAAALAERGDEMSRNAVDVNYIVFAQRYRGDFSYGKEMGVNLELVWSTLATATWAEGDQCAVIIGSVCATDPAMHESLAYNLSKAALPQLARFYAKAGPMRVNVVSPGTMRGPQAVTSEDAVADLVSFLCSPKARGVNGQEVRVTA